MSIMDCVNINECCFIKFPALFSIKKKKSQNLKEGNRW